MFEITSGEMSHQATLPKWSEPLEPEDLASMGSRIHPNLLKMMLHTITDAVIIADLDGRLITMNPAAEMLTGWQESATQRIHLSSVFQILHPTTLDAIEIPMPGVLQATQKSADIPQVFLRTPQQILIPIEYSVTHLADGEQPAEGMVVVFREVQEPQQNQKSCSQPMSYDDLTGLLSRYTFEQHLVDAVKTAQTLNDHHVLCYLDLDHFQIINEVCGYGAGDEFLRQISAILRKRFRKTDIVARLGGDEFGIILYQCSLDQANHIAKLLREEMQGVRFTWNDKALNCSISMGLITINPDCEEPATILSAAKSACRTAKAKGRNRIYCYEAADQEAITQRGAIQWLPRILEALEHDQFLLYVQPIVPLKSEVHSQLTTCETSYEILLRLQDHNGQIIAPGAFIPIAECYGLMHLIDRWVIRTLFAWLSKQPSFDPDPAHLYTVNLSGASINDDQFLEFVQEQFAHYQIPPRKICFEITETLAISNLAKATQLIQSLKAVGCSFALDDFGSGMSSFGYLKCLPVDYLKIDGLFVKDLMSCQVAGEIVEAINRIAHVMGIYTIAEFVENDSIYMQLQTIGVDYAQGFGIARPYDITRLGNHVMET
jgi:diguanylate cyclase (GGDEF)-like protein/PAS domain S-box-containing protein